MNAQLSRVLATVVDETRRGQLNCHTGGMDPPGPRAEPTQLRAGRPGLGRWKSWWDGLSDPERLRIYMRSGSAVITVAIAAVMVITAEVREPWQILALVVVAVAGVLVLESRPELSMWMAAAWQKRARRIGIGLIAAVVVADALVVRISDSEAVVADAGAVGIFALVVSSMAVVTFLEYRWWIAIGLGLLAGLAYGVTPVDVIRLAVFAVVLNCVTVALTLLTLWHLRVVDDLERARSAESELKVAQERLRFARDLHDVVGRGFSAVAVKSELAATLIHAGDTDRAAAEMEDVKTLAVESMERMRALVRGYRDVSLASEVAGARSLLLAAGCRMTVEGEADAVPQEFHEVAAWVVREGTTNIVKHTSASQATLSLGHEGMILSNDDATAVGPARSGHTGLVERLDAVGATMRTTVTDGCFALQVRWENQ